MLTVGCWARCRRNFFEAAQCRYPQSLDGLLRIAAIFAADKPLWKLPAAECQVARIKDVAPLIDSFFAWVHAQRLALPIASRDLVAVFRKSVARKAAASGKLFQLDSRRGRIACATRADLWRQ